MLQQTVRVIGELKGVIKECYTLLSNSHSRHCMQGSSPHHTHATHSNDFRHENNPKKLHHKKSLQKAGEYQKLLLNNYV